MCFGHERNHRCPIAASAGEVAEGTWARSQHVEELGLRHSDDTDIWDHALLHQSVIITKDEDFVHRFRQGKAAPVIVWLRVKNVSRKALLEWFEPLLPQIEVLIRQGERLIEVR